MTSMKANARDVVLAESFQETKVDTTRTNLSLNEALATYRVWQHGDVPWDDTVELARETINSEAKRRSLTFDQLLEYRADQSGDIKGPK